jgi:hypothetical protein
MLTTAERAARDVAEARRRAEARWAELTDFERQTVEMVVASVPDLLRRSVVGDAINGRQKFYLLTPEEYERRFPT